MMLDGAHAPDGVLAAGIGTTGQAPNSVNVPRGWAMLEVQVLVQGATPAGTFLLLRRGQSVMGPGGVARVADCGQFGAVTDTSWPSSGLAAVVSSSGIAGATFRLRYPSGEYTVYALTVSGGNYSASFALSGGA